MPQNAKLVTPLTDLLRPNGEENGLMFGASPETTPSSARQAHRRASATQRWIDPVKHRDEIRRIAAEKATNTFENVARDWRQNKIAT
jgi:hypothetical protein